MDRSRGSSDRGVVVLGAGRGLATVLRAMQGEQMLTAIVSIAYRGQRTGDGREQEVPGASSVEDLRRSLEALTGEHGALLRAIRRPLTIERLGRQPLGNFVLASVAAAFGDYAQASTWLGEQLGIDGAVFPATSEPVRCQVEAGILRFVGDNVRSPDAAVAAIDQARCVLLAPGSLYGSVLPTAAVPDIAAALRATPGRVVWIANLEPDPGDRFGPVATDQLLVFRRHELRVDVVLHDPSAALDPGDLAACGMESMQRRLRSARDPAMYDRGRLRSALRALIGSPHKGAARG